jgi:hypothetical protein
MSKEKEEIINLDECVLNALNLFIEKKIPKYHLNEFHRPLVVGSGNGAVTGKIIFEDTDAVFADESNYLRKLSSASGVDGCILVSSSGGKHAPIIAKELKKRGIKVILLTNNDSAPAKEFCYKTYLFPKNSEPYTYNTSTYMGMIISKTKENPRRILLAINKLKPKIPKNLNKFDSFFFIIPEEFENISGMFLTKFDELFGPIISARVFTPEQDKHAKTIIQSDKELFVGLGYENKTLGKNRFNIKIEKNMGYASMTALGYYFIGQIQKQNKPYFKDNIQRYVKEVSKIFNEEITVITK